MNKRVVLNKSMYTGKNVKNLSIYTRLFSTQEYVLYHILWKKVTSLASLTLICPNHHNSQENHNLESIHNDQQLKCNGYLSKTLHNFDNFVDLLDFLSHRHGLGP